MICSELIVAFCLKSKHTPVQTPSTGPGLGTFLGEISQGAGQVRKTGHEPKIAMSQSQELPN